MAKRNTKEGVEPELGMVPMLVPLVRLFMRAGLGVGEFELATRLAFVRVAADNARLAQRLNVSAIAATTGLTRKEVSELVSQLDGLDAAPRRTIARQRTVRVLQGWLTDPAYLKGDGVPKVLPMRGDEISFAALVRRFAGDVPPTSVLRELQRAGAVVQLRTGELRIRKRNTRHRGYSGDVLGDIARHVSDLAAALLANVDTPKQAPYVGFQEMEPVTEEVAQIFNAVFAERAGLLLEGITRWASSQKKLSTRNRMADQSRRRIGVGVYFIDEPASLDVAKLPAPPLKRKALRRSEAAVRKSRST